EGKFQSSFTNVELVAKDLELEGHSTTDVQGRQSKTGFGFLPGDAEKIRFDLTAWGVLEYRDVFQEFHTAECCCRAGKEYAESIKCTRDEDNKLTVLPKRPE